LAQVLGCDIHILERVDKGRSYTERAVLKVENSNLPSGSKKTGKPIFLAHVNNRSHYDYPEPRSLPENTAASIRKRQKQPLEHDESPQSKRQRASLPGINLNASGLDTVGPNYLASTIEDYKSLDHNQVGSESSTEQESGNKFSNSKKSQNRLIDGKNIQIE
jgi:hypothetical protein